MAFTIIKKAAAKALHKPTTDRSAKVAIKPTKKADPMLWGEVGRKYRKDGSFERIYNAVPYSEASPCLRRQFDESRKKKGDPSVRKKD